MANRLLQADPAARAELEALQLELQDLELRSHDLRVKRTPLLKEAYGEQEPGLGLPVQMEPWRAPSCVYDRANESCAALHTCRNRR